MEPQNYSKYILNKIKKGDIVTLNPGQYVIFVFGGVGMTARALGKTTSAVSRWKEKGRFIPSSVQKKILEISGRNKLGITSDDLIFGRNVKNLIK